MFRRANRKKPYKKRTFFTLPKCRKTAIRSPIWPDLAKFGQICLPEGPIWPNLPSGRPDLAKFALRKGKFALRKGKFAIWKGKFAIWVGLDKHFGHCTQYVHCAHCAHFNTHTVYIVYTSTLTLCTLCITQAVYCVYCLYCNTQAVYTCTHCIHMHAHIHNMTVL